MGEEAALRILADADYAANIVITMVIGLGVLWCAAEGWSLWKDS